MSPTDLGWLFEDTTQSIAPVTVPRGIVLVPEDFQCGTEKACGTKCYGCNKAKLGCTVFCEAYEP